MKMIPSCTRLPREQRCDHKGPGDFMGHTCPQSPQTAEEMVYEIMSKNAYHFSRGYEGPKIEDIKDAILALANLIDHQGVV